MLLQRAGTPACCFSCKLPGAYSRRAALHAFMLPGGTPPGCLSPPAETGLLCPPSVSQQCKEKQHSGQSCAVRGHRASGALLLLRASLQAAMHAHEYRSAASRRRAERCPCCRARTRAGRLIANAGAVRAGRIGKRASKQAAPCALHALWRPKIFVCSGALLALPLASSVTEQVCRCQTECAAKRSIVRCADELERKQKAASWQKRIALLLLSAMKGPRLRPASCRPLASWRLAATKRRTGKPKARRKSDSLICSGRKAASKQARQKRPGAMGS